MLDYSTWTLLSQQGYAVTTDVQQTVTAGGSQIAVVIESNGYTPSGINQQYYIDNFVLEEVVPVSPPPAVVAGNEGKEYRHGFNGKEKDDEVYGVGNFQDYGMRNYDPRIARLNWRVDPLTKDYPWYTPYQFAGNTPIQAIDLDGAEPAAPEAGKKNLLLVIQGWGGTSPEKGKTQVDVSTPKNRQLLFGVICVFVPINPGA